MLSAYIAKNMISQRWIKFSLNAKLIGLEKIRAQTAYSRERLSHNFRFN